MRISEGEKLFICDLCEKTFSQIDHLKIPNTDEKIFKCGICTETFHTNCEMTLHNLIHTGAITYSCDTCGKAFRTRRELTVHERFHTGEKPYSCELCKKSFNSCSNLSQHNKTAGHLKKIESTTSFVDCGEADKKLEIKEEETLDEDPISIKIEAESVEVIIKEEIKEEEGIESEEFV